MERRSAAMADRRAARLARISAWEREKEELARQEEEQQRAELEARQEREAVRQAEKLAAKQVRNTEDVAATFDSP